MSVTIQTPDLRRMLDDLARRVGILERRQTSRVAAPTAPQTTPVVGHTHDGAGTDSTVVSGDTQTTPPVASGADAFAAGDGAVASGLQSLALGPSAEASDQGCIAMGPGATSSHAYAIALGNGVATTRTEQVNLGSKVLYAGLTTSAPGDSLLTAGQFTFYVNEAGNTLHVKVKYTTGVVKIGTVTLT